MRSVQVIASVAALVGSVAAHNNGTKYTTVVTTDYVTYCPEPTTICVNNQTITVSKPTTLTITNCPCTITHNPTAPTGVPPPNVPVAPTTGPVTVPTGAAERVGFGALALAGMAVFAL